ncbi:MULTISPECIES: SMP-30/gluconolactonase/LRE family protein [unclassified Mesorhizobium]|uniref:SMP-30/gluconolactonase/LRE family protein n=1 Tax=unclassified Mesorhizobium TaxID=325217 RepID=UPI0015E3C472|nr:MULTISPECIES: SMP-30/gluconolactonase/LRE family protein [unclassified Mesorhizobium]
MSTEDASTLAEALGHPQGPDVMDDGTVVFAETYTSRLALCSGDGKLSELHHCGGGPNAVILGSDNRVYFTQNGGQAGDWRAETQRPPALEVFDPSTGEAREICRAANGRPFLAPHDLAWGPDGSLYMTDSGTWAPGGETEPGAIVAVSPDGTAELVLETGHVFPSGIAVAADGTIYWAECYTHRIMRLRKGGTPAEVCTLPQGHTPESLKIDANGNFWVAALEAAGFDIVRPNGEIAGFLRTGGLPLNGTLKDGRLYVADLGPFQEDLPAPQLIGRLQSVECGVRPGPTFRSSIEI